MKNKIKFGITLLIGIFIGTVGYIVADDVIKIMSANQVEYSNNEKTKKTNVQDAIDELYGKANARYEYKITEGEAYYKLKTYLPNSLYFRGSGEKTDEYMTIQNEAIQFGPYDKTITPGSYLVIINGSNLNNTQIIQAYDGQIASYLQTILRQTSSQIIYTIDIPSNSAPTAGGLEFILKAPANGSLTTYSIDLYIKATNNTWLNTKETSNDIVFINGGVIQSKLADDYNLVINTVN